MVYLDETRTRVLCDGHEACRETVAIVDVRAEGRVLAFQWGWKSDNDRVWRYSAKRAARTPPKRIAGVRHANGVMIYPWLERHMFPYSVACPSPRCRERAPQPIDPQALDVLPLHGLTSYTQL